MTSFLAKFKSPLNPTPWLMAIIVVAIGLRVAVAFYLGNQVEILPGTYDQVSYDMLARQVLAGRGFTVAEAWWPATPAGQPTAHWSYLYTLYLAAIYALVGYSPLAARLLQAILAGWLMPWLTYRLGRRYFNPTVGLIAAGLTAIYAYFVYYAAALMTETFCVIGMLGVLELAGAWGQATPQSPQSRLRWLWLGLALGLTVLLRQVFLLFIPFLLGWLLWRSYQNRAVKPMLGALAAAVVVMLLLILPWTWRNYRAFGSPVLLNTNAGFVFFWGNHPIHGYNFISILPTEEYQKLIPPELRSLNEAELDRALLQRGLTFIQADPVRYLILSFSRIKDYFQFWPSAGSGLISNVSRVISFGILWPFMLYGLVINARRALFTDVLLLYLFGIIYSGVHLLSWALIRYRLPVDAVLLLFAAAALLDLGGRLTHRLRR